MFIEVFDEAVYSLKIVLVVSTDRVKCADVKSIGLANNYQKYVFSDLHFPHKVLIVHDADLEVVAFAEFIELAFEIIVEFIHATTQAIQEIISRLLLELKVTRYPFVYLHVVFKF